MKTPKHSVGEVVIISDYYLEEVRAVIIEQVIITKKEIRYKGKLSFNAERAEIYFYDKDEFDYSNGCEPNVIIIKTIGMYGEDD